METWIQQAIDQWKEEKLELNDGASSNDFEKAESQVGYTFPEDFKKLYSVINGFVDSEMRGFMLSLWSLERIVAEYNKEKSFLIFSDHSLKLCQYGFNRYHEGIFRTYTHFQKGPIVIVAKSFKDFIELFNCDSEVLF